jgi:predicted acyl esterase
VNTAEAPGQQAEASDATCPAAVLVEFDVPASMRDGVVLRADGYRPGGERPWPTLVVRTPYGNGSITENAWKGVLPAKAARRANSRSFR